MTYFHNCTFNNNLPISENDTEFADCRCYSYLSGPARIELEHIQYCLRLKRASAWGMVKPKPWKEEIKGGLEALCLVLGAALIIWLFYFADNG